MGEEPAASGGGGRATARREGRRSASVEARGRDAPPIQANHLRAAPEVRVDHGAGGVAEASTPSGAQPPPRRRVSAPEARAESTRRRDDKNQHLRRLEPAQAAQHGEAEDREKKNVHLYELVMNKCHNVYPTSN